MRGFPSLRTGRCGDGAVDELVRELHEKLFGSDEIGVCVSLLAKKLGFSQPTTSRHLQLLLKADLLKLQRHQSWSFYCRNESEIANFKRWISGL